MSKIAFLLFTGKGLLETRVTGACALHITHNPGGNVKLPPLASPVQQCGTYSGEDWQIGFTQTPSVQVDKYFLKYQEADNGTNKSSARELMGCWSKHT